MGGLGKTTITRKLYKNNTLREKFDCYAWVSVSKDYNIQDLLQKTIKSFERPTSKEDFELLEKMKELDDLETHLRKYLEGRRYLVVVDDVWDVNAWASLRRAFPDNKNGSRVIMTTRSKTVAEHCDERPYVYELPFLKEEESWELFCKKAFPTYDEVGDKKIFCPPSLEGLAREMVSKCRGLPLALVVLGGVLHRKHPDEWSKLKDQIWRHVTKESASVKYILELSFNDLPHHLKSCFLYLGLFPEDYEIDAERLCWLWEAEGFIKLDEEPFEMAYLYLQQLIDRSLILVSKRNWRRIVKCQVHDLLRDLAIQKSKELNFLHIYDETHHSQLTRNSRRLASHCGFKRFVSLDHSDMHLRTLLFFNCENESDEFEIAQLQPLCMKLRLLRVLDLEEHSFWYSRETGEIRLLDEIGKLFHLRYLGLRGTKLNKILPSIGNLPALQTLELSPGSYPIQLPDEIRNAKQLRRLVGVFKWPFPMDNLTELRTLREVVVEDQMEFEPTGLINLCELWVRFVGRDKRIALDSIGGLRSLQALHLAVDLGDSGLFPALQPLSHCQNLIQMRLKVEGAWKLPAKVHQFLPNLKYLLIVSKSLTEDPFPVLEKLPNLTALDLGDYDGAKLVCSAKGFPQLEILRVIGISNGVLEVEEGGMPMLKGFEMMGLCLSDISERLRSIPFPPVFYRDVWPY